MKIFRCCLGRYSVLLFWALSIFSMFTCDSFAFVARVSKGRYFLFLSPSKLIHFSTTFISYDGSADDNKNNGDGEKKDTPAPWQTLSELAKVSSPWLTIYCERLKDDAGQTLDYWRVEKDDSVVILTEHRGSLVFPRQQYRPGCQKRTLDFCGGRVLSHQSPKQVAGSILQRELGISLKDLKSLESLWFSSNNHGDGEGWLINSSFSNQRLFGLVAVIRDEVQLDPNFLHATMYNVDDDNALRQLLREDLQCLQCRSILMEWLLGRKI